MQNCFWIIPNIPLLTLPCRAALTVWQPLTESLSPVTTVRQLITAKDNTAPPDYQETPFFTVYLCLVKDNSIPALCKPSASTLTTHLPALPVDCITANACPADT